MSLKIVAFGASSSKTSINKQLAGFVASQISTSEVNLLDLNDFEMPIYSIDKENESGVHPLAVEFRKQLHAADGIVISFAEHNGAYTAAFKNIFDWISRGGPNIWGNKPMLLLATSPGPRGAQTVLDIAVGKLSRMTENKVFNFSLPEFSKNFDDGITDLKLKTELDSRIEEFTKVLAKQ